MLRCCILFLLFCTPTATIAQYADYCTDAYTEAAYLNCMDLTFAEADRRLNTTYRLATASLDAMEDLPPDVAVEDWKVALRDAQRAWIALKDSECGELALHEEWDAVEDKGPILACRIAMTDARARELARRYNVGPDALSAVPQDLGSPMLLSTLGQFLRILHRHDWPALVTLFDEEGYLIQTDELNLPMMQILWETLGTGPVSGLGDSYEDRLNVLVSATITDVQLDDARGARVRGTLALRDGRSIPFSTYWVESMTGAYVLIVPVG